MKKKRFSFYKKQYLSIILLIATAFIFQLCTKTEIKNDSVAGSSSKDESAAATVADDTYKIGPVNNNLNAMALTIQSADDSIATVVKTYSKDSLSHNWHITKVDTGIFRISCGYSGKALATPSATAVDGQQLIQLRYDSSKHEQWGIKKNAQGQYRFFNKATNYYINLEPNGKVTQRKPSTTQSQLWTLTAEKVIYCDADVNNFFRRTSGWIASDGAESMQLTDGRVFWSMGDSHINDYDFKTGKVYCLFQVRNAGLLQPAIHSWYWPLTQTLTGNPLGGFQSYFKNKADDNYWMWPSNGFQLSGNDTLYLYSQPLKKKGSGSLGFTNDSIPIWCKVHTTDMQVVQYHYLQDFNGIDFGAGLVPEDDGYVYAFGTKITFIYANIYVARFPKTNPDAPWTFWTGSIWDTDVTKIKRVSEGASNSVSVVKYQGKYICISTEFSVTCDAGTHIYTAFANGPTGPFSTRKIIYQIPDRLQGHSPFWYAGNGHPEFDNAAHELLITYDINGFGSCVNTCTAGRMDPDIYRPKAIRVPAGIIFP